MLNKLKNIYPFFYGAFGSLGLICCTNIFLDFDYKISEHPYAHPFCLIAGSLSLIICMAVFCLDIMSFIDEERKLRRLLRTIYITLILFIGFAGMWSRMLTVVSAFIKYMGW